MMPVTSRFKDAIFSIRQRFGMESDLDRIIPFIVFERAHHSTEDQVNNLFADYPKQAPEDFRSTLFARIREIVRYYWAYCQTKKGYHKVLKGIIFLENVLRCGPEGCRFIHDEITGYRLELKKK